MTGIFIVLLVGVAALLISLGFFIVLVLSLRRTLEEVERTLKSVEDDVSELMPRLSSALQQVERTGDDIGRSANASTTLLNRLNGKSSSSPLVDGATRFLPAVLALLKITAPIFSGRRKKKRTDQ